MLSEKLDISKDKIGVDFDSVYQKLPLKIQKKLIELGYARWTDMLRDESEFISSDESKLLILEVVRGIYDIMHGAISHKGDLGILPSLKELIELSSRDAENLNLILSQFLEDPQFSNDSNKINQILFIADSFHNIVVSTKLSMIPIKILEHLESMGYCTKNEQGRFLFNPKYELTLLNQIANEILTIISLKKGQTINFLNCMLDNDVCELVREERSEYILRVNEDRLKRIIDNFNQSDIGISKLKNKQSKASTKEMASAMVQLPKIGTFVLDRLHIDNFKNITVLQEVAAKKLILETFSSLGITEENINDLWGMILEKYPEIEEKQKRLDEVIADLINEINESSEKENILQSSINSIAEKLARTEGLTHEDARMTIRRILNETIGLGSELYSKLFPEMLSAYEKIKGVDHKDEVA